MQFLGVGLASVGTSQGGDRPGGVPVASAKWTPEAGRVCQARGGEAFGWQEQESGRTPFVALNPHSYGTCRLSGHTCSCGWSECSRLFDTDDLFPPPPSPPGNIASTGAQCSVAETPSRGLILSL